MASKHLTPKQKQILSALYQDRQAGLGAMLALEIGTDVGGYDYREGAKASEWANSGLRALREKGLTESFNNQYGAVLHRLTDAGRQVIEQEIEVC